MQNQSQSSNLNYSQSDFEKWIDHLDEPVKVQQVLSKTIARISNMTPTQRDQIVSGLKNDARFSQFVETFSPQTA